MKTFEEIRRSVINSKPPKAWEIFSSKCDLKTTPFIMSGCKHKENGKYCAFGVCPFMISTFESPSPYRLFLSWFHKIIPYGERGEARPWQRRIVQNAARLRHFDIASYIHAVFSSYPESVEKGFLFLRDVFLLVANWAGQELYLAMAEIILDKLEKTFKDDEDYFPVCYLHALIPLFPEEINHFYFIIESNTDRARKQYYRQLMTEIFQLNRAQKENILL